MMRRPLVVAILAQVIAAAVIFSLIMYAGLGTLISPMVALLLQGGIAAVLGLLLRQPVWWVPIHLILPLAVWFALGLDIPAWGYLAGFVVMLLLFWNSAGERVPLYLSNQITWQALAELLPSQKEVRFVDLGSGLAGTLSYLSTQRPDGHFVGVESAPMPALLAWLRFRLKPAANVNLVYGDIWKQDLSRVDVVYCFLSSEPMPRLYVKARKEMRPGSLLISNTFDVPGVEPSKVLQLGDRRQTRLFLWRM